MNRQECGESHEPKPHFDWCSCICSRDHRAPHGEWSGDLAAPESGARRSAQAVAAKRIEAAEPPASSGNSWSETFKADPVEEGEEVAQGALRSKICEFVSCSASSVSEVASPQSAKSDADTLHANAAHASGQQDRRNAAAGNLVPWLTAGPITRHSSTQPMYQQAPEIILAMAPDPVHTHGALLFDRSMDAFEDALQDSGWDYQGSWMPWSSGADKAENATIEDAEEERLFRSGRERYPGVVLFRPSASGKRTRPLLLLILGDSPTTGIVAYQFRQALGIFLKLSNGADSLRILGPDFTGAEPSLYALLQNARDLNGDQLTDGHRPISVVSGTVSDSRCEHILPNIQPSHPGAHDCGAGPNHFVSFGVDGGWEVQQAQTFLEHHGLKAEEIAELSEEESGFGELLSHPSERSRPLHTRTGEIQIHPVLHLKFPRGIAHLRSAYQKNGIWGFGSHRIRQHEPQPRLR